MINYFKKLDFFSSPYEIKIFGKSKYSSTLGFLLTIIIFGVGIAVIFTQGSDLFHKLKPRVNTDILYKNVPDNYTLSDNGFAFAFTLQSPKYEKFFTDNRYYNVEIKNFRREFSIDDTGEIIKDGITTNPLDFELCKNNYEKYSKLFLKHGEKTGVDFTKFIDNGSLSQSVCLKDSSLVIGGEFNSGFFSNILFQVTKCRNKTETEIIELKSKNQTYVECVSDNEQNDLINGEFLQLLYTNYVINTNNYTYPFYAVVDNYFLIMDPTTLLHVDFYFRFQEIISDNGFVFQNNLVEKTLGRDYFREILAVNASTEKILNFYINISKTKYEIRRYYMKAQELAALVGGLTKFCIIIAEIISNYFNSYQYQLDLINQFFITTEDLSKEPELKINYIKLDIKEHIKKSIILHQRASNNLELQNINMSKINEVDEEIKLNKEKSLDLSYQTIKNNYFAINSAIKLTENLNELPLNLKTKIEETKKIIRLSNLDNSTSNIKLCNDDQEKNNAIKKVEKIRPFKSFLSINFQKVKLNKNETNPNKKFTMSFFEISFIHLCYCMNNASKLRKKLNFYINHLNIQTDYSQVLKGILSFKKFEENLD